MDISLLTCSLVFTLWFLCKLLCLLPLLCLLRCLCLVSKGMFLPLRMHTCRLSSTGGTFIFVSNHFFLYLPLYFQPFCCFYFYIYLYFLCLFFVFIFTSYTFMFLPLGSIMWYIAKCGFNHMEYCEM